MFDLGDGRVLRRNRSGASVEREAAVMSHVHAAGYPVPEVLDARGPDLVMERVDGPTMLDALPRRPWRLRRWARELADLHRRLAEVPVPEDLPCRFGAPETLVHADLHPDNVLLTAAGPVVIDWANACTGRRGAEAANTWVILATGDVEAGGLVGTVQRSARSLFLRTFLDDVGHEQARPLLAAAGQHRLDDPNLRPGEAAAINRLLAAEAA